MGQMVNLVKNTVKVIVLMIGLYGFQSVAQKIELADKTPELGYDIDLNIYLDVVPKINGNASLSINMSSQYKNISDLKIEVILPEGLVINQGKLIDEIDIMQPQREHQSGLVFSAIQAGEYKVTVKVTGMTNGDKPTDRYAYVFFTVDDDESKNQMGWSHSVQKENTIEWSASEYDNLKVDEDGYVTYSIADENLNHTEVKILEEDYLNASRGVGTVAVSGRYRFANRENNSLIGFNSNLLQIINATNGAHLAWTYSDSNGYYTFPAVSNPGNGGFRIRVYSVRFLGNDKGYGVCVYSDCDDNAATNSANYDQFYMIESSIVSAPDGNQNIGTFSVIHSLSTNLRAFWIKDDMDKAHTHLLINSTVRGPFTAEWSGISNHGNHYHPNGNIHFKSDVGDGTNHTVLHELGHNVMYNAGTLTLVSDCPDQHYISLVSGAECAWTEGWASAFLVLVNDIPEKCSPPSTTNCTNYETDPSFDNCLNWDCGTNADQVEGHVTGAIWDLYDNDNDDFDLDTFGTNEIYTLLQNETYYSFAAWWIRWLDNGYSDNAFNALFQNAIVYGTYDIRVNPFYVDDPTPTIGQTITVDVSVRNIGDVDSISTVFRFYLSDDSTITGADQLMGTTNYGLLNTDVTTIIDNSFSIASPGQYWVGACFVDSFGYDDNNSNNCSAGYLINVSAADIIFANGFD